MELVVRPRTLEFAAPFVTSAGTVTTREILEVDLIEGDAVVGRGEAAPLEFYDGVSVDQVSEALERYAAVIGGLSEPDGPTVLDACANADPLPQALAAVDIALWDRAGRAADTSIGALLTDKPAAEVSANATIATTAPSEVVFACVHAREAGFSCVKLKVGLPGDTERVAAARDALGPDIALRLDANGAWSHDEAVQALQALARFDPEYVEEPVHGVDALRALRGRTPVAIAMDESAREVGALASGAADAVGLKLSACGGISGLLAAASLVRAFGGTVYVTSTLDGPRGIAAAIHAASALAPLPACGLATLELFTQSWPTLTPRRGALALPPGAGLGEF